MRADILGVKFDTYTFEEAREKALALLELNKKSMIFTPNPEFVLSARKDPEFLKILNHGNLVIPDGIGIIYASRILNKVRIPERVPGGDLIYAMFDQMRKAGKTAYFLGAAPKIAERAKKNMEEKFPGLKVIGAHDGYFDKSEEKRIIEEINQLNPDFLLVGLGVIKQERWIYNNRERLNCRAFIGCGGYIDVMAGKVKRAPIFFQKLGLEWLYRLIKEPKRIKRQMFIPVFMAIVLKEKIMQILGG